jgi:hypothetical protein
MADALHAALPNSTLLKNTDTLRAELDMNRAESRHSVFRQQVAAALSANSVLIDTHSFPRGEFYDAHIVIMEARRSAPSSVVTQLLRCIADALPQLRVTWLQAHSTINDIEYTAVTEHGVALALLLEVQEELTDAQLSAVARATRKCFTPPEDAIGGCILCGNRAGYRSLALCGARVCGAECRDAQVATGAQHRLVASYRVLPQGLESRTYEYWISEHGILHSNGDAGVGLSLLSDKERMRLTALSTKYGSVAIQGSSSGCIEPARPWIVLLECADSHDALRELTDESARREIVEFFDSVISAHVVKGESLFV